MNKSCVYIHNSNCRGAGGFINIVARDMDGNDLLPGYNSYKHVKAGIAVDTDAYQGGLFDGYVSGVFDSESALSSVCLGILNWPGTGSGGTIP